MRKDKGQPSALSAFSKLSALGCILALMTGMIIPVSGAEAVAAWPTAPVHRFYCENQTFYVVDALGVASRGGLGQTLDENGNMVNGGNCTGEVTLDESVTSIDASGFDSALITKLTLPSGLTSIGPGAFGFVGITTLNIPDSVVSIGGSRLPGCAAHQPALGSSGYHHRRQCFQRLRTG
jgi:hypothetical protein